MRHRVLILVVLSSFLLMALWRVLGGSTADGLPVVGQAAPGTNGSCPATPISVVAIENFYGSLVRELGGQCVNLVSIVSDPSADPHEYEPTANDAKAFQTAKLIVENGLGYDDFSDKIVATLSQKPVVLNMGAMLGLKMGDNPHIWYSSTYVDQIVQAITDNLKKVNPDAASYYDDQAAVFSQNQLADYHATVAKLRSQFKGVPIGSTESIFEYAAEATGLNILTSQAFMDAVSESNDPSAKDIATFQRQITSHEIKVLVYNTQTDTKLTEQLKALAVANNIPIVGVSETMPQNAPTFLSWQIDQLQDMLKILDEAGS